MCCDRMSTNRVGSPVDLSEREYEPSQIPSAVSPLFPTCVCMVMSVMLSFLRVLDIFTRVNWQTCLAALGLRPEMLAQVQRRCTNSQYKVTAIIRHTPRSKQQNVLLLFNCCSLSLFL